LFLLHEPSTFSLLTALNPVTQLRYGGFFYWRQFFFNNNFFLKQFTRVLEWLEGSYKHENIFLCFHATNSSKENHFLFFFFFYFLVFLQLGGAIAAKPPRQLLRKQN